MATQKPKTWTLRHRRHDKAGAVHVVAACKNILEHCLGCTHLGTIS